MLVSAHVAAESRSVRLPIAARAQARGAPASGWCGETALQEALLYYGAYVTQRHINRAGRPRNPDLYWDDLPRAMTNLGLRFRRWSQRGGLSSFLAWTRAELRADRPVLAGVKIYPTEHPRWGLDHIVLVTGFDREALRINSTWGHAITRSYRTLGSTAKGFSFHNRYRRQHAFAIDGLATSGARARLSIRRETKRWVYATLTVHGLVPGRDYQLERALSARGRAVQRWHLTAAGARERIELGFDRARPAFFRAKPAL